MQTVIERLVSLVEQGHDPALLVERVLWSLIGAPGEVSIRRLMNASTQEYLGGEILNAETGEYKGQQVIFWTVTDKWGGKKLTGV